jgi:hypothetical protein
LSNEELCLLLHHLELIYEQNKLIACYLNRLIPRLDRFNILLEQLILPIEAGPLKVRRLSGIKGIKKVVIKEFNVHHLDHLEFNLDNIDIDQLSGVLNIGISEEFTVKHIKNNDQIPKD